MKILLVGNPNVGKSALFNRLTGADVIISNYPGTTVGFTRGKLKLGQERMEVIDVPGTYTLEPTCKAEEIAVRMLDAETESVIVNVVDATNLERSLYLTLQLVERKRPMVIVLNLWDEAAHVGIKIDVSKLEEIFGVPCIPTCAISGEGIKRLVEKISSSNIPIVNVQPSFRWQQIGGIISSVQTVRHRHHTIAERLSDATLQPLPGLILAAAVLWVAFTAVRFIGEGLIGLVFGPFFENAWKPLMTKFSAVLGGGGIIHDFLIGRLINGGIDYGQSFGLLTTGLFVPIGAVLPYIFAFYTLLSILEDSGYLPRLAVILDVVMHRLGLHGLAIVPTLLGLGCNVPGMLSARILETRREKFIALTLMSIAVPCMALQAMVIGLVGKHGAVGLGIVFGTLFVVWVVLGLVFSRLVKGDSPEIFIEIPPYRFPYIAGLVKKIWIRIKWFLKEAVPFVLLGVLIANVLYTCGIVRLAGRLFSPVITGLMGLPADAAGALIIGFLRKDVAVGMLVPLGLSLKQLVIASVVLSMFFPCIATFSIMLRELGARDMAKAAGIMIISSIFVGTILNIIIPAGL
jgi:ferrous iron transport protein B